MCQSCQTCPAKFGQILLRTVTRLVFCNRKLMRTDIFFPRTTKPICNFVNSVIALKLSRSVLFPLSLYTSLFISNVQFSGMIPVSKIRLDILYKTRTNDSDEFLKYSFKILSRVIIF
jgi:hypothetical protein